MCVCVGGGIYIYIYIYYTSMYVYVIFGCVVINYCTTTPVVIILYFVLHRTIWAQ